MQLPQAQSKTTSHLYSDRRSKTGNQKKVALKLGCAERATTAGKG